MRSFKRLCFVALLMLVSANVFAGSLSIKDGKVKGEPGKTGTIDIYMTTTDEKIEVVQFDLVVPKGVSIVLDEDELPVYTAYRNLLGDVDMGFDEDTRTYTILAQTKSKKYVEAGEGLLISFEVEYSSDYAGGAGKLTEILLSGTDDDYCDEVEFTFEVGAAAETEKITLTKEYNTYVPAKDLDFTGLDIKAYYVTEVTSTEATLTEATTVAAGEGIILKGTADAEYEVPVATEAVTPNSDNLLATGAISEGDYILYEGVFVPCSGGTLPDGKAFLPKSAITSGAKVISLVFGGGSTGINEIQKAETEGAIYNLSGMRVSKTQKGVYIMNGRKVIVK